MLIGYDEVILRNGHRPHVESRDFRTSSPAQIFSILRKMGEKFSQIVIGNQKKVGTESRCALRSAVENFSNYKKVFVNQYTQSHTQSIGYQDAVKLFSCCTAQYGWRMSSKPYHLLHHFFHNVLIFNNIFF